MGPGAGRLTSTDDRFPGLTPVEERMLTRYAEAYRFYRYGRTMDFGTELDRLVRPLNDTFDYPGIKTMLTIAYLLCSFSDLHRLKGDRVVYSCLARKVFGREHTKRISDRVQGLLQNGATVEGARLHKSCARSLNACCSCARRI